MFESTEFNGIYFMKVNQNDYLYKLSKTFSNLAFCFQFKFVDLLHKWNAQDLNEQDHKYFDYVHASCDLFCLLVDVLYDLAFSNFKIKIFLFFCIDKNKSLSFQ